MKKLTLCAIIIAIFIPFLFASKNEAQVTIGIGVGLGGGHHHHSHHQHRQPGWIYNHLGQECGAPSGWTHPGAQCDVVLGRQPQIRSYGAPVVIYTQPTAVAPPAPPQNYWYYCANPQGYYPYVQQCPGGWTQVPSTPQ